MALGLAVVAVVSSWGQIVTAADSLSVGTLLAVGGASVAYVLCTLAAWRVVLADLGSRLPWGAATAVFGLSQVGKYVPGGVWNVVAAAELGAEHQVPRRRSLAAMLVALLVSVVSGCAVGAVALPFVGSDVLGAWSWLAWVAPVFVVALLPPVLNRIVGLGLRLGRGAPMQGAMSWRGLGLATLWSVVAWLFAGFQLWLLATALGMDTSARTLALAVAGYALAWVVGFLVVVVPAGAGAREAVLLAVLAGSISHGAVVLTVLSSRVVLTVTDFALAGAGLLIVRRRRPRTVTARRRTRNRSAGSRRPAS
ncbi:lysylphosphatidylglycerol synthase domain-containing protein [Cellulosimicrobium sp. CUA-896]|uniref:lysylphosphatidylglycerol synthase domain-containing protein n=1 Tax=Cellulosimicrobium sp. CUA-896 TaxID=1517881 RepID=UPI002100B6C0|nr:lysylphosphatidylglycerol synthase domain-containing protein [Cellulosimicrobium sp. CUA-896]